MAVENIIKEVREAAQSVISDTVEFTDVRVEGSSVVLYTKNMEAFAGSNDIVRKLAQKVRKRIIIRADPAVRHSTRRAARFRILSPPLVPARPLSTACSRTTSVRGSRPPKAGSSPSGH